MIVVDTGVLYALINKRDMHHRRCADWLSTTAGPLVVPPLLSPRPAISSGGTGARAEAAFLEFFGPGQALRVADLSPTDFVRVAELVREYADLPLGGADASVVAIAERLDTADVATIDHRHFTVVRPRHVPAFRLLPE